MSKKTGLSRGLEHLFDQNLNLENENDDQIVFIEIDDIIQNPYQPRKKFDEEKLNELSESIKNHGVFQPILVRKAAIGYEIISGERRYRASKLAKKEVIPAIVYNYNDEQMMEIALVENIQRENLSILEEAESYNEMYNKLNLTQNQIAQKVGKSRSHVANIMRILKLDDYIIKKLENNDLTMGHIKTLVTIEDKNKQKEIVNKIINNKFNVRDSEKLINDEKYNNGIKKNKTNSNNKKQYKRLEELLISKLDTKVNITGKNKGSIIIDYISDDDLERILEVMNLL